MAEAIPRAVWLMALLVGIGVEATAAPVPLIDAIKAADKAAIRLLLEKRVDVNAAEPGGATPLHWAARTSDAQTADLLIRAGANVKAANRYGVTPLYLACTMGNAAMIDMLLKAGADPNTALPEGETALMTAARSGTTEGVNALLARGADVNRKETWRGQTALMWAAAEGHVDVIHTLLAHGADLHARVSGVVDHLADDDVHALAIVRSIVDTSARSKRSSKPERTSTNRCQRVDGAAPQRSHRRPNRESTPSCWLSATCITSLPRSCWTRAPTRTPRPMGSPRCIRFPGDVGLVPETTTRRPKGPAIWTAWRLSGSSSHMERT